MAAEEEGAAPSEMAATFKVLHDHSDRIYQWDYERNRTQLVGLYTRPWARSGTA